MSNSRKKEIKSVTAGEMCFETMPCTHDITIQYKDGTEENKSDHPEDIIRNYGDYLNKDKVSHITCFANFFNKNQNSLLSTNQATINLDSPVSKSSISHKI
jgi:hypothetical protein